jgi:glycosyltransferase involved in cell wall biosynthesis
MGFLRSAWLRFSIITVNKNDAEGLRRTIDSVKRNAPRDREYIIIDGASSDGSVGVIEDERSFIDTWVSEPDTGIYQAMNKGIARAKGDFCLFLNSGDVLCDGERLESVPDLADRRFDIYYSDAALASGGARSVIRYPKRVDVNFFVSGMINHQNTLIRRSLFDRMGLFDESLRLCSDWLLFLRTAYSRIDSFKYIGDPISEFSIGGLSNGPGSGAIVAREREYGILQVFGELAPSILELVEFRESTYGNTVSLFGRTKALDFLIRLYRFFARRSGLKPSGEDAIGRS